MRFGFGCALAALLVVGAAADTKPTRDAEACLTDDGATAFMKTYVEDVQFAKLPDGVKRWIQLRMEALMGAMQPGPPTHEQWQDYCQKLNVILPPGWPRFDQ